MFESAALVAPQAFTWDDHRDVLAATVHDTWSIMLDTVVQRSVPRPKMDSGALVASSLRAGPTTLTLVAPRQLAGHWVRTWMGEAPGSAQEALATSDEEQTGIIAELLNTVAGAAIARLENPPIDPGLGLPQSRLVSDIQALLPPEMRLLSASEGSLTFDGGSHPFWINCSQ